MKYWIIGASSGIGREIAMQLSELGNEVVVSSSNKSNLEKLNEGNHEKFKLLSFDVSNKAEVNEACNIIKEDSGDALCIIYMAARYDAYEQDKGKESKLGNYENIINNPSLEGYKSRDINVLILDDPVDSFWTSSTPSYLEKIFKSVTRGADDLEKIDGEKKDSKENKSTEPLINLLKEKLKDKVKDVRISSRLTDSAVCLVSDEGAMDPQLEKILQQHNQLNQGLSLKVMEINPNHKLIKKLSKMSKDKNKIEELENNSGL